MKKMIYVLAIASLVGSVFASASQLPMPMPPYMNPSYTAKLDTFNVDPNDPSLRTVVGGTITREVAKNNLRLMLFRKNNCPAPRLCIAMMPAPVMVVLPITSVSVNACGSTVYTARLDRRPVDGGLQVLQLADNSTRKCKDLRPGTEVRYTTKTSGQAGFVETFVSNFSGGRLERDFPLIRMDQASEE